MELTYDLAKGPLVDGWLHAIFRYNNLISNHQAETSFGSHIFNLPVTYRNEPQSYSGKPPGLTTRLYARLGEEPLDTLLHIIYPASKPWREKSQTKIRLMDSLGDEIANHEINIPCGGSRLVSVREVFGRTTIGGEGSIRYVLINDAGCRLFGYHALIHPTGAFSLDHMFGF